MVQGGKRGTHTTRLCRDAKPVSSWSWWEVHQPPDHLAPARGAAGAAVPCGGRGCLRQRGGEGPAKGPGAASSLFPAVSTRSWGAVLPPPRHPISEGSGQAGASLRRSACSGGRRHTCFLPRASPARQLSFFLFPKDKNAPFVLGCSVKESILKRYGLLIYSGAVNSS